MLEIIRQRFALSIKGAKDFCKGVFFTTLLDIALMLPAVFTFVFLEDYSISSIPKSSFLGFLCVFDAFFIASPT